MPINCRIPPARACCGRPPASWSASRPHSSRGRLTTQTMPIRAESPAVQLFTTGAAGPVTAAGAGLSRGGSARTVLQVVLDRLCGHGPPAHQVWLPPLEAATGLDALLSDAGSAPDVLTVPIGVVDRPFEQCRTPLMVDLSGAAGNVAVVGAPQSGKSTALRTLITAFAATHDAGQVQFYCLDFGGGTLASLRTLPHVGAVAGRAEPRAGRAYGRRTALGASDHGKCACGTTASPDAASRLPGRRWLGRPAP